MTIGARLKEWRTSKNLSQKDASSISGVSFSTYQNYEMDISPPGAKSLTGFINAGINANWLMTGEGPMLLEDAVRLPHGLQIELDKIREKAGDKAAAARNEAATQQFCSEFKDAQTLIEEIVTEAGVALPQKTYESLRELLWLSANDKQNIVKAAIAELSVYIDQLALVPFYDVEASAGHGSLVDQEQQTSQMAFRKDWLKQKGLQASKCALIKAKGDSMEPTIHDGDLLLVDTSIDSIKDDSIYIIQADHHLSVKRIQQDFDGSLIIISDNPRYKQRTISPDQAKEVKIAGRVRWYGHEI